MYSMQELLKEQIEERRETARKVWKIYIAEMERLIENQGARPDTSTLERFIENESGTFGQSLAKLFIDAIEFGFYHAEDMSKLCIGWQGGEK